MIGGIPNQLFYTPEFFGFQNCGLEVTEEDISNIDSIENVIERRRACGLLSQYFAKRAIALAS